MLGSLTRPRSLVLLGCALTVLAVTVGATAAPRGATRRAALACGSTITSSVTLTADVTGCNGIALRITGDHVALNLGGHLVSGGAAGSFGIEVDGASATVTNGRITGFATGVPVFGAGAKLQNLRIWGGQFGVSILGSQATLTGSTIFENTSNGVNVGFVTNVQVTNNNVRGNTLQGIHSFASNAVVSGNKVVGNGTEGIAVQGDGTATVTGNIANGNGSDGIFSDNDAVTLAKNTASFNTKLGIDASPGDTDGGSNRASANGSTHQCTPVVCS